MRLRFLVAIFTTSIVFIFASGIIYFNQSSRKLNTIEEISAGNIKTSKTAVQLKQSKEDLIKAIDEIELLFENLKFEFTKYETYEISWANYGFSWEKQLEDYIKRYNLNRTLNVGEEYFDTKRSLIITTRDLISLKQQYNLELAENNSDYRNFEARIEKEINEARIKIQ